MLSCGDAVSADMPAALTSIAQAIDSSGKYEQFKAQPVENGMEWLRENEPNIYKDITVFLEKHGHRAVMEVNLI